MRKHEFRGKMWDRKWVHGDLWDRSPKSVEIIKTKHDGTTFWPVLDDTVGENTGFLDVNKVPIFEGDILEIPYEFGEGPDDSGVALYEVRWSQPDGGWNIYEGDGREEILDRLAAEMAKVVGNIWDNPDMMEGGHEKI